MRSMCANLCVCVMSDGCMCVLCVCVVYLLNVEKRKSNSFPEVIAIFTCDFEMLIEFFFDQRIILHGYCIPHEILRNEQRKTKS